MKTKRKVPTKHWKEERTQNKVKLETTTMLLGLAK